MGQPPLRHRRRGQGRQHGTASIRSSFWAAPTTPKRKAAGSRPSPSTNTARRSPSGSACRRQQLPSVFPNLGNFADQRLGLPFLTALGIDGRRPSALPRRDDGRGPVDNIRSHVRLWRVPVPRAFMRLRRAAASSPAPSRRDRGARDCRPARPSSSAALSALCSARHRPRPAAAVYSWGGVRAAGRCPASVHAAIRGRNFAQVRIPGLDTSAIRWPSAAPRPGTTQSPAARRAVVLCAGRRLDTSASFRRWNGRTRPARRPATPSNTAPSSPPPRCSHPADPGPGRRGLPPDLPDQGLSVPGRRLADRRALEGHKPVPGGPGGRRRLELVYAFNDRWEMGAGRLLPLARSIVCGRRPGRQRHRREQLHPVVPARFLPVGKADTARFLCGGVDERQAYGQECVRQRPVERSVQDRARASA